MTLARLRLLAPAPDLGSIALTIPAPRKGDSGSAAPDKLDESVKALKEDWLTLHDAKWLTLDSALENNKTYYLSDFGIGTLGYFNAADNEKNAYHIDGDPDDSSTSGNADKLKSMIASSPDTVISFFTQMSQNLYAKMSEKSKSVEGYRSFGSLLSIKGMTYSK